MEFTPKVAQLVVRPLEASLGLRRLASDAIKLAITEMDIYGQKEEVRLDERQLSRDLGVSRTPIREALSLLEQEGFVRSVPRRGIYIVRKTKRQIVEMITVWSAIESMAARLACVRATAAELAELRAIAEFHKDPHDFVNEYSIANMAFHKAIIRMSGNVLMVEMTDNLFVHMRAIRAVTMRQEDRAHRSLIDHMNIVATIEARDEDLAARRVRDHTLGLAAHVEAHGDFLDRFDVEPDSATASLAVRPASIRRDLGPGRK
jgi:DNA-binding GntR family transcriptional regulator